MLMSPEIRRALELALEAGESVRGTTSPNPPVGCAIVDPFGDIVGVGATQSPTGSGEHAEVMALRAAGDRARGASAVVTLEPCNHTGRTGPCTHALVDAGITAVYYATRDPNPLAAGGAEYLREHGVSATYLGLDVPALQFWLTGVRLGRPHVTVKMASTLDGFSAAEDGTSQWITGEKARQHAHGDRACRDAIVVGTGTVIADNPKLTARTPDGSLYPHQPQPVVIGRRPIPRGSHLDRADVLRFESIDAALADLWERGQRDVLVEGGPRLVGSFLSAGLVDTIHSYLSPSILGGGLPAVNLGLERPTTLTDIRRFQIQHILQLGEDILIQSTVRATQKESGT